MNQCRAEKTEPSTMYYRCKHDAGHQGDHEFFLPDDSDLVRKDRDALVLQNRELLQSIEIRERNAGELMFQVKDANRLTDVQKRKNADLTIKLMKILGAFKRGTPLGHQFCECVKCRELYEAVHAATMYGEAEETPTEKPKCEHKRTRTYMGTVGWLICADCEVTMPDLKRKGEVLPGEPKECDHGELLVIHKCADCGEVVEFV